MTIRALDRWGKLQGMEWVQMQLLGMYEMGVGVMRGVIGQVWVTARAGSRSGAIGMVAGDVQVGHQRLGRL